MTRLESGALQVRKEWHLLEEIVGATLERLEPRLEGRRVQVTIPEQAGLVPLDDVLVEQALFNLVENAVKHTPAGTPIEIRADVDGGEATVEVADRGPGIRAGDEQRVFEKFYRAREGGAPGGIGLGLTIARGIVEAHGGSMTAANREGGGAVFRLTLPVEGTPPTIEPEEQEPGPPAGEGT